MITVVGSPSPSQALIGFKPVDVAGVPKYVYIAYADDAIGTGFSLVSTGKNFIAILNSDTAYTTSQLVASLFAGLWWDRSASSTFAGIRSDSAILVQGTNTVNFSSPLASANYILDIYEPNGIGVSLVSQTTNGFTVNALEACTITYHAIIKI